MDRAAEGAYAGQALLYLLRTGGHARRHHAPNEWADKYKGKFDQGYDKLREETFARQKKLGVIPADAQLTARNKEVPSWDEMPAAFKPVLARQMEVYAGFMEYTDYHVGPHRGMIEKLNLLDDTLIYYIVGDNGASAEGPSMVCFNEMSYFNGLQGWRRPNTCRRGSTNSADRNPTTTTRWAGRSR